MPNAMTGNPFAHEAGWSSQETFFPAEPREPVVRTAIPGPKGKELVADLDRVFDTRSLNMMANYNESLGN